MQYQDSSYKLQAQRQRSRALAANFDLETGLRKQNVDEDVRLTRQLGQIDIVIQTAGGGKIIIPGVNLTPVDIYAIEPESGFNFRFSCTANTLQNLTTSFSGTNFTYTAATSETGYATFIYSNGSGTVIGIPIYVDNIIAGARYTMTGVPSGVTTIGVIFICSSSPALDISISSAGLTTFPPVSGTIPGTDIPHTITNSVGSALSMTAFSTTNSQHIPFVLPDNSTTFAPGFSAVYSTSLIVLDPDTTYPLTENELSTDVYLVTISSSPLQTLSLPFSVECSDAGNGYISFVLSTALGPLPDDEQPEPVDLSGPFNQLITIDPIPQDIILINYYYATDPVILDVDSFPYTPESVDWFKVYEFENNTGVPINITYINRDNTPTTINVADGATSSNIPNMIGYSVVPEYVIFTPNDEEVPASFTAYSGGALNYRGSELGVGYIYLEFYNGLTMVDTIIQTISNTATTTVTPSSNATSVRYSFFTDLVQVTINNDESNGLGIDLITTVPYYFQNTGTIPIKITITDGSTSTSSTTVEASSIYTFSPPLGYTAFNAVKQYSVSANGSLQDLADYTGGNFEIKGATAGSGWITFIYTDTGVTTYLYKTITISFTAVNSIVFDTGTTVQFAFYSTLQTFTITNAIATGEDLGNPTPYIPYNRIINNASSPGAVEISANITSGTSSDTYTNPELALNASVTPGALTTMPFIQGYTIIRLYTITPANGANLLFNDTTVATIKYKYSVVGVTGPIIYFVETDTFIPISNTYAPLDGPFDTLTAYYYSTLQTLSIDFFSGSALNITSYIPYGTVENSTAYTLNLVINHVSDPTLNIPITGLISGGSTSSVPIYNFYNNYSTAAVYLPTTGTGETTLTDYQSVPFSQNITFIVSGPNLKTSNLYLTDKIIGFAESLYSFTVGQPFTVDLTAFMPSFIKYSLPDTLTIQNIEDGDIDTTIPLDADKAYTFTNNTSGTITLTFTQLIGPPPIDPQTIAASGSYTPAPISQLGFTGVDVTGSAQSFTLTCSSANPPTPEELTGYSGGAFSYNASANPTVPYITFNFLTNSGPGSDVQYAISTTPATITPAPDVIGVIYVFACNYFNANITSVPVSNVTLGTGKPWSFTNNTGDDIELTILIHPASSNISYTKTVAAGATFYPTPADGPSNNGGPYNLATYSAVASGPGPTTITIASISDGGSLTNTTEYTFDNTIVPATAIIITLTKTDTTTISSPLVTTSWTPTPASGYTDYSVAYPEYTLIADLNGSEQTISGWTTDEKTISYKADTLGADITQVFFIYYDNVSTEISSELKPIDTTNNTVDIPDSTASIVYRLYDSLQFYDISSLAKIQSLSVYIPYGTFFNSLNYDVYISADRVNQQLIIMGGNTSSGITDAYNNIEMTMIVVLQNVGTTETLIGEWFYGLNISLTCPEGVEGTITFYFYDASDQLIGLPFGPNTVSNNGIGSIDVTDIISTDLPSNVAYINYTTSYTFIP